MRGPEHRLGASSRPATLLVQPPDFLCKGDFLGKVGAGGEGAPTYTRANFWIE
jgi:hypothetical protein